MNQNELVGLLDVNSDLVLQIVEEPLSFALPVLFEALGIDVRGVSMPANLEREVHLVVAIELTCFLK